MHAPSAHPSRLLNRASPPPRANQFPQPGYLLICSDGLWGVVSDTDIFRIIQRSETVQEACRQLVEAANNEGGPDNISVILVKLPR